MKSVQLRLAYSWVCPECKRILAEPIPDMRTYNPPAVVTCESCELEFAAKPVRRASPAEPEFPPRCS